MAKEQRKKVNQNIKYNMAFKMTSPLKHAPYAKAHTRSEGKVSHRNTAEAHGKKTEDFYDGSRGKQISTTGAKRITTSGSSRNTYSTRKK